MADAQKQRERAMRQGTPVAPTMHAEPNSPADQIRQEAARQTTMRNAGCGCLAVLGILATMAVIGSFLPEVKEQPARNNPKVVAPSPASVPAQIVRAPGPHAKNDALKFAETISETAAICDIHAAMIGFNLMQKDDVGVYQAAGKAAQYCAGSAEEFKDLHVPPNLDDDSAKLFREALDACPAALSKRVEVYKSLQVALDGGNLAQKAEFRDKVDEAVGIMTDCDEGVKNAAIAAGASAREVKKVLRQ